MTPADLSDLAWLGLIVAAVVCACAVLLIVGRCRRATERDDGVAAAASGMDEFSAPEGGKHRG